MADIVILTQPFIMEIAYYTTNIIVWPAKMIRII